MTRVYIGCFGSGLGHAARMLETAGALTARGTTVELSSSDEVATLIELRGYRCNRLPLADVRYSETGEFSLKDTLVASPSVLGRTFQQLGKELGNINRFAPDVVISDSSLPTVLAAKFLGLPVLTVLNQLNLTGPHYSGRVATRLLSAGISSYMGRLWELSDEVLLPDLPPPYTISERNLWGSHVGKTRYVGFLPMSGTGEPDATAIEFSSDRRPKVFWQVSGPPKTRISFLKMALECARMLADEYAFVIAEGSPTSDHLAHRIPGGWSYGWCDIADVYFRSCDLVVSRAGHGTIGQAISCSKPSLIVPIPKQPEQEGNAQKAVRLGTSLMMSQGDIGPATVRRALGELRGPDYVSTARKLGSFALRYDAREEIVKSVEAATSRTRRRSH
jgi:UDP-N-acetylglucosamine--N-acetylmuramyl-(pentapeptide) pyrophosphoryl-undecaprenol N-acetylglucosamine transferase